MKASEITKRKHTFDIKKNLIFFVIAFVLLNIINLKYCFSFFVNSVIILLLLFVVIGIIFMVLASIEVTFSKFRISSYIGILSLVCIMTVFSGKYISGYQANLSKEKATVIIEALNNYKKDHNEYPENLSDLVPEYLESISNSLMGWFDEPYEYFKREDGSFDLTFPSYGGGYYITSANSNGNWRETD